MRDTIIKYASLDDAAIDWLSKETQLPLGNKKAPIYTALEDLCDALKDKVKTELGEDGDKQKAAQLFGAFERLDALRSACLKLIAEKNPAAQDHLSGFEGWQAEHIRHTIANAGKTLTRLAPLFEHPDDVVMSAVLDAHADTLGQFDGKAAGKDRIP